MQPALLAHLGLLDCSVRFGVTDHSRAPRPPAGWHVALPQLQSFARLHIRVCCSSDDRQGLCGSLESQTTRLRLTLSPRRCNQAFCAVLLSLATAQPCAERRANQLRCALAEPIAQPCARGARTSSQNTAAAMPTAWRPPLLARLALCYAAAAGAAGRKRGHDAFWIMDPSDQLCLTTHGTLGPATGMRCGSTCRARARTSGRSLLF